MGIMWYSSLWVMQDLYHQQYQPFRTSKVTLSLALNPEP